MKTSLCKLNWKLSAALLTGLVLATGGAWAQTTWTGNDSATWGTAGNWTSGVPSSTVDAIFNDTASRFDPNATTVVRNVRSLFFQASSNTYSIGTGTGGELRFATVSNNGIFKSGTSAVTITAPINFQNTSTVKVIENSAAGTLNLNGQILMSGTGRIEFTGSGVTSIGGSGGNPDLNTELWILQGRLNLNKATATGNSPALRIGPQDQSGAPGSAEVRHTSSNNGALAAGTSLFIYAAGVYNITAVEFPSLMDQINLQGGDITASGTARIGANTIVYGSAGNTNRQSTISTPRLLIPSAGETHFEIANRMADAVDLEITSEVYGSDDRFFRKSGGGWLLLSGAVSNIFEGTTQVQAGRLILGKDAGQVAIAGSLLVEGGQVQWLSDAQALATTPLTMEGGSLLLNTFSQTFASINVNGDAGIDFGLLGENEIRFTTSAVYNSGSLTFFNWNPMNLVLFEFDPTSFVNTMGSNLAFDGFGTGAIVVDLGGGLWTLNAIPEPSAGGLLLLGAAAAWLARRRRQGNI